MHQRQRALDALVAEVGKELGELRCGEHALVDERPTAERREVGALLVRQLVLDALAGHEQAAVEGDPTRPVRVGHEQLLEARHHCTSARAKAVRTDRHVAPPDGDETLVGDDRFDRTLRLLRVGGVGGQERQADRVLPQRGQRESGDLAEEAVGHLDQNASAITTVCLGTRCAAVLHVAQRPDAEVDDGTTANAVDVRDEGHAAGIVFEPRVVETRGGRKIGTHVVGSTEVEGRLAWRTRQRWLER